MKTTGLPIADVLLAFQPEQPGKLLSKRISLFGNLFELTTDGTFSVVMPESTLKIQVVGDCGNYETIPFGLAERMSTKLQCHAVRMGLGLVTRPR